MNFEKPSAWADAFEAFFAYFASFFHRNETRKSAQAYLRGLLADVERKNGWQLAEATGLQILLNHPACPQACSPT